MDGTWLRTTPIAHRGLHDARLPENSMPAFTAAVRAGYGIELDVQLSRDGRLVVLHDASVARMTGTNALVAGMRCAELTRLRLLDTGYTVPTLDDVLEMVAGEVPVLVEVKPSTAVRAAGAAVCTALRHYPGPIAVQSFDPRLLIWLRRHLPLVCRGQLAGSFDGMRMNLVQKRFLRGMALNTLVMPDFLAFEVDALPSMAVSAWRRLLRCPLLVWTVRTPEQLARAERHDANVIFEDVRPAGISS